MKPVRHLLTLILLAVPAFAQTTFPNPFINAPAPPAPVATASVNGTPGISQYLYVVVAHYPSGDVPSNVIVVNNGAATLTSTNKIVFSWPALPFVTNYDVLRVTANPFTYANCTCAIAASATTALTLSDTGAALNAYTVRAISAPGVAYWDLQVSSYDAPRLRTNVNGTSYQDNIPRGTSIPTYCTVGDEFFKTDATAGANLYLCTSANTWTQLTGSGGTPGGAAGGDLSGTYPNPTVQVVSNATKPTTGNVAAYDFNNITTIIHDLIFPDNTYDIGKSGATRPREGFFGTSINAPWVNTLSSGTTKTALSLNSTGANYGTIQTETAVNGGTWSLGYQPTPGTTIGTNVITWNGNGFAGVGTTSPSTQWDVVGTSRATTHATQTNCSSAASPAVCATASAGSVVVAAAATTVVVNTTAVTANSQIMLTYDAGLGTKLGVTCNVTEPALYGVGPRVPGTSFTITATASVTDPACFSYVIFN